MNSKQLPALGVDNLESTLDTILPAPAKWSTSSMGFSDWLANITSPIDKSYHAQRRVASADSFNSLLAAKAELAAPVTSFENGMLNYFTLHQRVAAT